MKNHLIECFDDDVSMLMKKYMAYFDVLNGMSIIGAIKKHDVHISQYSLQRYCERANKHKYNSLVSDELYIAKKEGMAARLPTNILREHKKYFIGDDEQQTKQG